MKTLRNVLLCAWVLWGGPAGRLIMPVDGYETKAECRAAEVTHVQRDETQGRKSSYQCLPTGTDPRPRS